MAAVTIAAVAKKVAATLVSNKKGRKFIGYVIGISIFILCIPLIAVLCLFGWTSGNPSIDYQSGVTAGVADMFNDPALQERFENIQIVFTEYDLSTGDIHKAQFMSIKKLAGLEEQENFPTHVRVKASTGGLFADSVIMLDQVRTIDKTRLRQFLGRVDGETLSRIEIAAKKSLGIID